MFECRIADATYDLPTLDHYCDIRNRMGQFHSECAAVSRDLREQVRHSTLALAERDHADAIASIRVKGVKVHQYISGLEKIANEALEVQTALIQDITELKARVAELERMLVNVDRIGDAHVH